MRLITALILLIGFYSSFAQVVDSTSLDEGMFIDPEGVASFPGGNDSLLAFINKNLIPPATESKAGKVFVGFIVNTDGTLSDLEIVKGLTDECNRNAIQVVKKMLNWIPGTMYNKPVRQRFVLPIKFD
jgi:periplasmic protein TonB